MTKKTKVGILSTFYNNYNYGGKLQAYALARYLNQNGCDAVQVQYNQPNRHKKVSVPDRIKKVLRSSDYRHAVSQMLYGKCLTGATDHMKTRKAAFARFDEQIPHTPGVYSDDTIGDTVSDFDVFVCGSDQIWNPGLTKKAYYLGFVPAGKGKFSYAASIADDIPDEWKRTYSESLSRLDAISVREEQSRAVLQEMLGREVSVTVDPTLLLDRADWASVAAEPLVKEPYVFCYFLGYSHKMRRTAARIAGKMGLKVVTIPHLLGTTQRFYPCDEAYGQEKLYDVSPDGFLALIRDAEYVFTDSFHATVLSLVFQKQFVAFGRTNHPGMASRMEDLLGMFGMNSRFCPAVSEKQAEAVVAERICYRGHYEKFEARKAFSKEFLRRNLENLL